jgi:hypothetical protein
VAEQHAIHDASASTLHELHDLLVNKSLRLSLHFCSEKNQRHLRGVGCIDSLQNLKISISCDAEGLINWSSNKPDQINFGLLRQ